VESDLGQDQIIEVHELHDLHVEVIKDVVPLFGIPPQLIEILGLGTHSRHRQPVTRLRRGMEEGQPLLDISVPGLDHPTDNLHVLLRHRPRSIPQAQESA
jgi:hypothetical protein